VGFRSRRLPLQESQLLADVRCYLITHLHPQRYGKRASHAHREHRSLSCRMCCYPALALSVRAPASCKGPLSIRYRFACRVLMRQPQSLESGQTRISIFAERSTISVPARPSAQQRPDAPEFCRSARWRCGLTFELPSRSSVRDDRRWSCGGPADRGRRILPEECQAEVRCVSAATSRLRPVRTRPHHLPALPRQYFSIAWDPGRAFQTSRRPEFHARLIKKGPDSAKSIVEGRHAAHGSRWTAKVLLGAATAGVKLEEPPEFPGQPRRTLLDTAPVHIELRRSAL
jgi:hypothetical protein